MPCLRGESHPPPTVTAIAPLPHLHPLVFVRRVSRPGPPAIKFSGRAEALPGQDRGTGVGIGLRPLALRSLQALPRGGEGRHRKLWFSGRVCPLCSCCILKGVEISGPPVCAQEEPSSRMKAQSDGTCEFFLPPPIPLDEPLSCLVLSCLCRGNPSWKPPEREFSPSQPRTTTPSLRSRCFRCRDQTGGAEYAKAWRALSGHSGPPTRATSSRSRTSACT